MYQGSLRGRGRKKIEIAGKELGNNIERAGRQDGDFIYGQTKTGD